MSARHIYLDETKRAGYVMAAVTVADPEAVRRVVVASSYPASGASTCTTSRLAGVEPSWTP